MQIKKLNKPAEISDQEIGILKKEILSYLVDTIYKPLIAKVPSLDLKLVQNSKMDALAAIRSGRIVFYRGQFRGRFSSAISSGLKGLGAEWDPKTKSWKIPLYSLPKQYREEIEAADVSYSKASKNVLEMLDQITHDINTSKVDFKKFYETATLKLDQKLDKQMENITVAPQLTTDELQNIADEYSNNLSLHIKGFADEQIISLRKKVEQNFYSGNRYENLVQTIKNSYKVSDSKAQFLARQETKLLSSQYQEQRAKSSGSSGYIWHCVKGSPKHPVREGHLLLDGQFILWDSPPVVDPRTGRRAHAGEDFGCRCQKEIVFKFDDSSE